MEFFTAFVGGIVGGVFMIVALYLYDAYRH